MSDNSEEKEFKLKGVIPAKVTTPEAFREALENLREYHRRSPESFADILEKDPSFIEEIKKGEGTRQIFNEAFVNFAKNMENQTLFKSLADIFEKNPSLLEEIKRNERRIQIASEVLESFANYLEKHPSILEEVMKEHERGISKEESSSNC